MQDRCTCSPAGLCLPRKKTTVTAPAWLGFWSLDEQTLPATVPPTPGVPAVPDPARPTWCAALPSPTPDLSRSWPPGPWFTKALGIGPVGEESTTLVWLPLAAASKASCGADPPRQGMESPAYGATSCLTTRERVSLAARCRWAGTRLAPAGLRGSPPV